MSDEPRYTLAEAEVLLREKMRRDSCLVGPGAPGHDVQEYVTRNFRDEICLWSMGCRRCGAWFEARYPE